jgi:hypothetical protein
LKSWRRCFGRAGRVRKVGKVGRVGEVGRAGRYVSVGSFFLKRKVF